VNAACDNALVTAYARGKRTIGWREIGEAMRDLRRQVTWAPSRFGRLFTMLAAAAIGGGIALGVLMLVRDGWPPIVQRLLPNAAPSPIATAVVASPTPVSSPLAVPVVPVEGQASAAATPVDVAPAASFSVTAVVESPTVTPDATSTPEPVASPTVDATAAHAASGNDLRIRVTVGDTLTDLAVRYYGNASPRVLAMIKAANPWLNDPDVIWIGKVLVLPPPRNADTSGEQRDGSP
jgi:nucleoid-associated protein YgaU